MPTVHSEERASDDGVRRPPVSCLVFTLNEEVNLPYCLRSLNWCDDVVVIDSHSCDATASVADEYGVRFVQHEFTGFGDQRNWALVTLSLKYPWALILDADERVPPELVTELADRLRGVAPDVSAFRIRRRFHLWGRWLRYSSLYPTWVVRLVRVGRVEYVNRGHAETQIVHGRTESVQSDLIDENQKGIQDWWRRQITYAWRDAEYELTMRGPSCGGLFSRDPLTRRAALKSLARRLPFRPFWFFIYCYVVRGGFLDGADGFRFCCMKATYQMMVDLSKRELQHQRK